MKGTMYFEAVCYDCLGSILIFNLAGVFRDIFVGYTSFPSSSWKPYRIDSRVTPMVYSSSPSPMAETILLILVSY